MNGFGLVCLLTLGLGCLIGRPLPAQEKGDSLSLTGDLGFVNTAGNTNLTTINVGEELHYLLGKLALGQTFGLVYGRSEGVTTSALWRAGLRGDYALAPRVSAFALLGYDRNRFAGIARRLEEGIGIGIRLLQSAQDRLELEGGLSWIQQRAILGGADDDFPTARAAGRYAHYFTEKTFFQQLVEVMPNLEATDDLRLNTESSLVAPLSRQLALKVSYVIRFDNVPEPGFAKTDRLLTTGLQITL